MGAQQGKVQPALVAATIALVFAIAASSATAGTRFGYHAGFDAPQTPAELDRVGVLKVGPKKAENVLVLNAGTSSSAAWN